jgi:RNA polymerase sigma-70 factor (ECF subfamily)
VSRARGRLEERRARYEPDAERRAPVATAFMLAAAEGEMQPLVDLLTEDVVLRSDSAGKRPAPRKPLHGPDLVLKFLMGVKGKGGRDATFALVSVNGTPGFVAYVDGEADSIYGFDVVDGRVAAIHALRDPERVSEALARAGVPLRG